MKITIKREQNQARMGLPSVSNLREAGAKITIKREQNQARMGLPSVSNLREAKKFLLVIVMVVMSVSKGWTQNDSTIVQYENHHEPSRVTLLKDQVFGMQYQEGKFKGHWAGIFVGFSGLANTDYSDYSESQQDFLDLKFMRSNVININPLKISAGLQRSRNNIGFVTGLGLEINSWRFDKNIAIAKINSRIEPVDVEENYGDPRKSKLVSTWLSVPLLFEFQMPVNRDRYRVYFSTGVVVNKRLSSHTKLNYRDDGQKRKLKTPSNFYMHDLRYSATLRMGYRWVNLFATYDLSPLFKDTKGPETFPWSVGIALISF